MTIVLACNVSSANKVSGLFSAGGRRLHKIGIVAQAREPVIALEHCRASGELPQGATRKPALAWFIKVSGHRDAGNDPGQ
jgi:hypothetical protein